MNSFFKKRQNRKRFFRIIMGILRLSLPFIVLARYQIWPRHQNYFVDSKCHLKFVFNHATSATLKSELSIYSTIHCFGSRWSARIFWIFLEDFQRFYFSPMSHRGIAAKTICKKLLKRNTRNDEWNSNSRLDVHEFRYSRLLMKIKSHYKVTWRWLSTANDFINKRAIICHI